MPLRKIQHPVGAYTAEEKKEFAEMNLTDHAGVRLTHGKPKVNGVEIHYAIGGAGEPVFLLHGTPKTMSYWRHVVPLLTPHYTRHRGRQPRLRRLPAPPDRLRHRHDGR